MFLFYWLVYTCNPRTFSLIINIFLFFGVIFISPLTFFSFGVFFLFHEVNSSSSGSFVFLHENKVHQIFQKKTNISYPPIHTSTIHTRMFKGVPGYFTGCLFKRTHIRSEVCLKKIFLKFLKNSQ